MTYYVLGAVGLGLVGFIVWFLLRTGRKLEQGEESAKKVVDLEIQSKAKNTYIRDVDRISEKARKARAEVREAFRRGTTAGELAELLEKNFRKNP